MNLGQVGQPRVNDSPGAWRRFPNSDGSDGGGDLEVRPRGPPRRLVRGRLSSFMRGQRNQPARPQLALPRASKAPGVAPAPVVARP
jgi:hypothetical protein